MMLSTVKIINLKIKNVATPAVTIISVKISPIATF